MGILILDCELIDCIGGPTVKDAALLIEGNRIANVGSRGEVVAKAGNGHAVLSVGGDTLLPGLWDAHVHLGASVPPWEEKFRHESEAAYALRCLRKAQDNLNVGVTSIRTMGDRFSADIELKGSIARGVVIGPRLWVAGDVGWSRREAGADTFRKMARERLRQGADHIKLFNTGGIAWPAKTIGHLICTAEEIRAAVEEAHHWGKPAVVHAMGDEGMIMAAEAGADSIEHGFVMGEASIDSMKKHGTVFSPQLAVTAAWNEEFMRAQGVFPEWLIINAVEAREVHHAMVAKAHKAGIPMISGVDNLPKIPLQAGIEVFEGRPAIVAEIHFMQKIGMTALEALQTATINAARVCGAEESLGTLEVGKLADVIAVRGNPLDDLERLQNVRLVMKDGEVIRADHALPRGVGLARPGDVSANRQIVMDAE